MDLFTRLGDVNGLTAVLDTRADILVQMGEPLQALPGAVQAVEQAAVRHDDFMLHRAQRTLGRAHAALGRLVESESVLRDSIAGFERLDRPLSRAASLRDLGRVLQPPGPARRGHRGPRVRARLPREVRPHRQRRASTGSSPVSTPRSGPRVGVPVARRTAGGEVRASPEPQPIRSGFAADVASLRAEAGTVSSVTERTTR